MRANRFVFFVVGIWACAMAAGCAVGADSDGDEDVIEEASEEVGEAKGELKMNANNCSYVDGRAGGSCTDWKEVTYGDDGVYCYCAGW